MSRPWTCLIRGLASVALGVAILAAAELTLEALLGLLGVYALVAGLAAITAGAAARGWLVIGALDLVFCVGVFVWPGAAALALLWLGAAVSELRTFKPRDQPAD